MTQCTGPSMLSLTVPVSRMSGKDHKSAVRCVTRSMLLIRLVAAIIIEFYSVAYKLGRRSTLRTSQQRLDRIQEGPSATKLSVSSVRLKLSGDCKMPVSR
ncbi:hypothetical protein CC85DRAFT_286372 [Cutaneotrichosporon oleaginosum]|uniref:Uncharacterized protein n=1 Tax=Cutaneotrichosporon oleaginosum TaxID=879819 RepID=A0A0J0XKK3_9TREE|nr:uncharacterized protein CC85DRAFT_286372 [Cutaneotrichosporon oleaginosum]KLT41592.1 hypothetical protein CC85DRAFT_286372 [Cutaneotrichosporon oleaginosum]TXT09358.1 hypothetical protein COLE_03292 [Cutaneotrichosporon oleaginosum]